MASPQKNWHSDVFFGLHYDLHARETDKDLGAELTHEHLRERLVRIRPDWVQCDCKGHPGYTSWPTKVGSSSPGIVKDTLRIHRDVTREMGIKLGMHYSGVIDQRAVMLHPEWGAVDAEGTLYQTAEHHRGNTCLLSDYADKLMIPQLIEIIDNYDVDGFWVDGENWGAVPCWCDRCRDTFKARTGLNDIPKKAEDANWTEWLAFHRGLFIAYLTKYTNAVHERKPDCLVCSNWSYTIRQPEPVEAPVDYLSGDYTPNWGATRAALEGRFLDMRAITWDLMCWGFTRNYKSPTSKTFIYKNALHLAQEISGVLALGGAVMIYPKQQRSGWLDKAKHEMLAEVADFARKRKDFCFKTKTYPEAAVLHLASHYYSANAPLFNYGDAVQPVEGALNILLENHVSTDLLNEAAVLERLDRYKLVVVPEQTNIPKTVIAKLETFAENGGQVIYSGAHWHDKTEEALDSICFEVDGDAVKLFGPWKAAEDGESFIPALKDMEPEKDRIDDTFITRRAVGKGAVITVGGPIFRNYFLAHDPLLRRFFGTLLDKMAVAFDIRVKASPRLEIIARQKDGRILINLLNRGAGETLSPNRFIVEELPPVDNITLNIRRMAKPKKVQLLPLGETPEWSYKDGWIEARVPSVAIHNVLAID